MLLGLGGGVGGVVPGNGAAAPGNTVAAADGNGAAAPGNMVAGADGRARWRLVWAAAFLFFPGTDSIETLVVFEEVV